MSGDYSRWSFDPLRHFGAVLKQQGRVDTDADWNELVALTMRRIQAGTLDTIGPAAVPRETPDGFRIDAAGGALTIGVGRMYVDGLLVENHGRPPRAWDARLAEERGTAALPYAQQPYYPNAPALPAGGPHLAYLKVWQREVTHVEAPDLVEPALGVDTGTRLQTVWQVRVLPNVGPNVSCATPLEEIDAFVAAEPPALGRLTTGTADVPGDPDPCLVPPTGGYRGLENQLYRVEIHRGGGLTGPNRATFKWSRDNASVCARVTAIPSLDRIVVDSVGRDDLLRFSDGDWIEITDDWRELHGQPGEMRRIRSGGGVDDATRTILLEAPLVAGQFPVDAQGNTSARRNTRIRRWDQSGEITDAAGTLLVDLDQPGAAGTIPVQGGAISVALEHGVVVTFDLAAAGGVFRTGDHWVFAARTADASVEELVEAPPLGMHAHYAKLAIVTFPGQEEDCRILWPPAGGDGHGCDCTVCVTPESHASGALTIQAAVNQVRATGGTVCLGVGAYPLQEPVLIDNARSVRVRGQGSATMLLSAQGGQVIEVRGSTDVTLEQFGILTATRELVQHAVTVRGSTGITLERCGIAVVSVGDGRGSAIGLERVLTGVRIERCVLYAHTGIAGAPTDSYLVTLGLQVVDNALWCSARGVSLPLNSLHMGETRLAGNLFVGCDQHAIQLLGGNLPMGAANVVGNLCVVGGDGILCGLDAARIADNDIRAADDARIDGDGIVLVRGLDPGSIDHCQILTNRIRGVRGAGIAIRTAVASGMIKHNIIAETGRGIVIEDDGEAETLVVENNQLLDVASGINAAGAHLAAMQLVAVRHLDVATNTVGAFARTAVESATRVGLRVVGVDSVRISGNRLGGIAPAAGFLGMSMGIDLVAPFRAAQLADNTVSRRGATDEKLGNGRWLALVVRGARDGDNPRGGGFMAAGPLGVAAIGDRMFVFNGSRLRAMAVAGAGDVTARGNVFENEESDDAVMQVIGARGCVLSENRMHAVGGRGQPSRLVANRAVVSGNDLRGPGDTPVLDVRLIGKGAAAIVGNVRSGPILLNGAALPAPWEPLNPFSAE